MKIGTFYHIQWKDGLKIQDCCFKGKDRGFLIFIDATGQRVVCREDNIEQFIISQKQK